MKDPHTGAVLSQDQKVDWMAHDPESYFAEARKQAREELEREITASLPKRSTARWLPWAVGLAAATGTISGHIVAAFLKIGG